jgi:hypothetical protein
MYKPVHCPWIGLGSTMGNVRAYQARPHILIFINR